MSHVDRFGRTWDNVSLDDYCPTCGQPDTTGQAGAACDHKRISMRRVDNLGGGVMSPEMVNDLLTQVEVRDATIALLRRELEQVERQLRDAEADRDPRHAPDQAGILMATRQYCRRHRTTEPPPDRCDDPLCWCNRPDDD